MCDARAFLGAIGEQGRHYYANQELPLYAVSRGLALWWLTMPGRVRKAPLPLSWRYVLVAVPGIMASLDVVENGCVARMLWTWPDLSHDLVHVSSLATRVKIMTGADRIVDGRACDVVVGAAGHNGWPDSCQLVAPTNWICRTTKSRERTLGEDRDLPGQHEGHNRRAAACQNNGRRESQRRADLRGEPKFRGFKTKCN